jgi:hypothetical protein
VLGRPRDVLLAGNGDEDFQLAQAQFHIDLIAKQ